MARTTFHRIRSLVAAAYWLGVAVLACASSQAFAYNVYTVGGDAACGYAFVQDAIDAAAGNPGEDYVFIASNRVYGDQHLVVTDQDVDIVGGFPDCTQLGDPGLLQTTIGGTSGHSVFEIEGTSHVYLSNLVITGAVMDGSHHGGGIYFGGAGDLTIRYSWVFLNQAGYGGGIAVNPSGPTTLNLIGSTVSANTALDTGGGIQIEGPTTLSTGIEAGNTNYIANNVALGNIGDGGGIKVIGPAVANLASAVVDLNSAAAGGGISAIATSQGPAYVNLYTTNPDIPVTVYGNIAQQSGGGVFLLSKGSNLAKLCAFDFAIDANTAVYGGAIMAATDDAGDGSLAFLNSDGCDRPADAVVCTPGAACNEINDNISSTSEFTGAVHVASAGALSASRFAMRRNTAASLIWFDSDAEPSNGGGDYVHLHDCLLVDNILSGNLLYAFAASGGAAQTQVLVDTCTVANNQMGDVFAITAEANFAEITNSIIYQPGHDSLDFYGPAGDLTARYILTNDPSPFAGHDGIVNGAPLFVDAANGDYHQARMSPGVDFAPANDGVDLDGNPRTVDLTDVVDQWGPLDVGAYEIQAGKLLGCSVADTIFCNGFEDQ